MSREQFQLDHEDYKKLFEYFFPLYIIACTKGKGTDEFEKARFAFPELETDFNGQVRRFLKQGTALLRNGYSETALSFLLDHLFIRCADEQTSNLQRRLMNLAKYLIKDFYYPHIDILMDLSVLWNKKTKRYAETHFFPKLPKELQEKYLLTPDSQKSAVVASTRGQIGFRDFSDV